MTVVEVKLPEGAALEKGFLAKIEIGHLKSGEKKEVRWRFKVKPAALGSGAEAKEVITSAMKAIEAAGAKATDTAETKAADMAMTKSTLLKAEVSILTT